MSHNNHTLLQTWHQQDSKVFEGGNTIATAEDDKTAYLMSKAPELWRMMAGAQTQLEMASKCLEEGDFDGAKVHMKSLWRERKEMIDSVSSVFGLD